MVLLEIGERKFTSFPDPLQTYVPSQPTPVCLRLNSCMRSGCLCVGKRLIASMNSLTLSQEHRLLSSKHAYKCR